MCNRTRLCLMGVVACLVLAAVWALVATPRTALGKPPRAQQEALIVDLVADLAFEPVSLLWAPATSARTVGTGPARYHFLFDPDQDAGLTTSDGVTLSDGVGCNVYLDKKGRVTGLRVRGQDVPGEEGIMHVSYDSATDSTILPIDPPVDPAEHTDASGVFTLHVHLDGIEIWRTDSHSISKKMKLLEMVGTISIADIVFTPQP